MLRGPRLSNEEFAADPRSRYRSLLDMLEGTAERAPRRGMYIVDERGHQEFRTYPQILEAALRFGAGLEQRGLGRQDRVLFVLPTSFEFVTAFFGAVSIGAIPVPIAPPPADVIADASDRAEAVLRMSERLQTPAVLFATSESQDSRPPAYKKLRHVLDVGALLENVSVGAVPEQRSRSDIAYMQPTGGATGRRRAVELTHRNILTNVDGVGRHLDVVPDDIGVSWLPLHSILGLVGVVLFATYWEIDSVLMHPERFLRRPDEWLHLFGRHQGTLAAAPSFGFDYCVRRCQESQLADLDLSSWRVAMNGGEPVRVEHMEAFHQRFGRFGLSENFFAPVYGLTEGTLAVTFAKLGESVDVDHISRKAMEQDAVAEPVAASSRLDQRLRFVSVGQPIRGIDVMVIDHRGIEVADRIIGEVAVRGPNVMRGYFDQPKKSSTGGTRISGEWLMTGDLGYIADDRLFVVGRAVETIRLGKRHLQPHVIEDVLQKIDGVRAGSAVLFVPPGEEHLVVAVEIQEGAEANEIEALVRSRLYRHFRLEPQQVRCISPQSVPRSPTGKVRRHLVTRFFDAGMLDRKKRTVEFDGVRRLLQRGRHQALKLGQTVVGEVKKLFSPSED